MSAMYDEAMREFAAACELAEAELGAIDPADPTEGALQACVDIAALFEQSERQLRALRIRAQREGLRLFRAIRREARE